MELPTDAARKRDFLSTEDLDDEELANLFELADRIRNRGSRDLLKARTLGLIFQNPSLRTRVSFEVAMTQLGGASIQLAAAGDLYATEAASETVMDGTAEEHVKDAARTLSRYLDAIGVRDSGRGSSWDEDRRDLALRSYARHASVPVINLQSNMYHPCQALGDIFTMQEKRPELRGQTLTLAWTQSASTPSLGIPHSLVLLASRMGMQVRVAHPQGFELDPEVLERARANATRSGGELRIVHDLEEGVRDADFVYARSWRSIPYYRDPDREALMKQGLDRWILTREVLDLGKSAWFLQPLPVRRNQSVTDEVLDGERSLVYTQAENRLHVQKALLVQLLA